MGTYKGDDVDTNHFLVVASQKFE